MAKRSKGKVPPPPRIDVTYATSDTLCAFGPLVAGAVGIHSAMLDHLDRLGRPVPESVLGRFLVDTGATSTCIGENTAAELGILPVGTSKTRGAGGVHENKLYPVQIVIPVKHGAGTKPMLLDEVVMGIPDLHKLLDEVVPRSDDDDARYKVIGLLGRDFLQHTVMKYDGPGGRVLIHPDKSIFEP